MTVDIASIERSARAALPALAEVEAAGWVIRVSGGATKRVNSANPIAPGARLGDVLARAEEVYAAHRQPVRFRLTPLAASDVDPALAARGYTHVDASWTMVAPCGDHATDPAVQLSDAASFRWLAGYGAAVGWSPAQMDAHATVLARMPSAAAVAILDEGEGPLAWGIAAIASGRACLFDIAVAPDHRGRGRGRRLVAALLAWASAAGCDEAVLQVAATNAVARRLYRSMGFVDAYPYHYRIGATPGE